MPALWCHVGGKSIAFHGNLLLGRKNEEYVTAQTSCIAHGEHNIWLCRAKRQFEETEASKGREPPPRPQDIWILLPWLSSLPRRWSSQIGSFAELACYEP